MPTFKQKARQVEAVQFTLKPDNVEVVGMFCDGAARWLAHSNCMELDAEFTRWYIYDNDWVVRYWDGHGFHYWVMKPEAFNANYEVPKRHTLSDDDPKNDSYAETDKPMSGR